MARNFRGPKFSQMLIWCEECGREPDIARGKAKCYIMAQTTNPSAI